MIKYIILLFLLVLNLASMAQFGDGSLHTQSRKAEMLFEAARANFDQRNTDKALGNLKEAVEIDPAFYEAWLFMASIYHERNDWNQAISCIHQVIDKDTTYMPKAFLTLGTIEYDNAKYDEAKKHLASFIRSNPSNQELKIRAQDYLNRAVFADSAIKHIVPFNPINLGPGVNSKYKDYLPAISTDEEFMIFARTIPRDTTKTFNMANAQEDFYITKNLNGKWGTAVNIGPPINSEFNEGAQTVSPDGRLFVFTGCPDKIYGYPEGRSGLGSCDLYYSARKGKSFTTPKNIGAPVNTKYWDSQPSFSSDGRTLYFISNRPGGQGGMDIYTARIGEDGKWTQPKNLGPNVNSPKDEMSPFIHADGKTLYFCSNGLLGFGQHDLFITRMDTAGNFEVAQNLGYPINTNASEMGLAVSANGGKAFFASSREGGYGDWDLYSFELPVQVRADHVAYFKGKITDKSTQLPLNSKFELVDLETGKVVVESYSDSETGEFLVCLPPYRDYALNVSKNGYLFYSENFSLKDKKDNLPVIKDVALSPIKPGEKVVLKNVFFDTNKFNLKPESRVELNKLAAFLNANPTVKIELGGHTDNVGDKVKNQVLSENRAKAVYQYLIDQKIPAERLSYKGYGDTQPIDDNKTEKGRANNRRTEFKII